jgi:hypothetical protein
MKRILLFFSIIILPRFLTIAQTHFINDTAYRHQVEIDFAKTKLLAEHRANELFKVFELNLTLEEQEAMKFLYAYMPLSDLADYNGKFFLNQVRTALLARKTFSWGKKIPEEIFRHFVLPYRVNNENLDSARSIFFNELKDRIINLSMREAALEVNHWCHEKVNYKGTDIRTSAPLSTVKTAYGRCGEESTFTVTALRAVGIPARQVYTPRWAHCDDNHAWVEVWMDDGKWHYLGACEPEPDLDIAWFSAPVLRAMMCNTTVFGNYKGTDEKLKSDPKFIQINLISNYAPTKQVVVKTVDAKNKPVQALVEYKLYNYAEFYTLAKKQSDAAGYSSLTTGLGDLMIWGSYQNKFGFKKVTVEQTDTLVLVIDKSAGYKDELTLINTPPIFRQPGAVDSLGKQANNKRLKAEDSIREKYQLTFIDSVNAIGIAAAAQCSGDSVWRFLKMSRGNWGEIARFILKTSSISRTLMYQVLQNISEKDLRDVPSTVIEDQVRYSDSYYTQVNKIPVEIFWKYVVNPRIANEILSQYLIYFQIEFNEDFKNIIRSNPANLVEYVNDRISVSATDNFSRTPITPVGTHTLRHADAQSRNIYFIAILRSIGIPARINTATGIPEYFKNEKWNEVYFENTVSENVPKGKLIIDYDKSNPDFKPLYYIHFTIAKLTDGSYQSLDYEESPEFNAFPAEVSLDTGSYMIVTGIRDNNGSVNVHLDFFTLKENERLNKKLQFVFNEKKPETLGIFDMAKSFNEINTNNEKKINALSSDKGLILAWIDPDREPTKHTMVDFQQLKSTFEQWNGNIVFLMSPEKNENLLSGSSFKNLPRQTIFGKDTQSLLPLIESALKTKFSENYPIFLLITGDGKILDFSSGYKIGRGEQIAKMLKYLN